MKALQLYLPREIVTTLAWIRTLLKFCLHASIAVFSVTVGSAKLQSWNALTLSPNLPHWFSSDPFMEKRAKSPSIYRNKHALLVE